MTTKAQHFVWRNYLKRWTNEGNSQGKIFVYNKNPVGNQPQFPDNPVLLTNVGFGKYYYDVTGFTEKDVVLLEKLIAHMQRYQPVQMDINPDVLSEANNHRDFIEEILGQYENIDNRHDFLGRITENDLSFYKDSFAQNVMNKLRDEMSQRILFQEITHSDEDLWKDFLNGMDHVSDEDLKHEFLRFFFVQYFRSPVRIDAQKRSFEDFKDLYPNESKKFNTDFYVKYQMIFLAEQVALNLSSYFHTWIERIENQTEISFITSDTPAINLTGTDLLDKNEFYYPISPYVAIKLCITSANNPSYGQHDNENIVIKNPEDVQFLNRVIFSQCKNEVFANHRSILEKIASNAD